MSKLAITLFLLFAVQNDVIRVTTRLVQVNVVVRGKNGPLSDLTKADFTILDNKKPQRIEVFSILDARKAKPELTIALPPGAVANRLGSSGEAPLTATVILFDTLNSPNTTGYGGGSASGTPERQFQQDAIKELVKYLRTVRAQDRIGLYLLANEIRVLQDFTSDPERLVRAAARIKQLDVAGVEVRTPEQLMEMFQDPEGLIGPLPTNAMLTTSAMNQATTTADAFESIARHLSGIPGRKNLIWMSAGFPFMPPQTTPRAGDKGTLTRETPIDFSPELSRASHALNNANVGLYPVDVRALEGTYPEVMLRLSDATGGRASYYSNDLQGAVRGAVEDAEVSYVLGFYSTANESDKSFHDLTVKVNRKDVDVRHRAGYYPSDNQKTSEQQRQAILGETLASPMNASQVGMIASAVPEPGITGSYRVTVVVDARDIQFTQLNNRQTGALILATRLESSKTKTAKTATIPVNVSEEQFKNLLISGFILASSFSAPGRDRLKIAIQDQATGLAGSIWLPLDPGPTKSSQ